MPEKRDAGFTAGHPACRQFDMELEACLEGEDRPVVFAHARECPWCRTILADLELIRRVCREIPLEEPSASVWANVRATLAQERVIHEAAGAWPRWFQHFDFLPKPVPIAALAGLTILAVSLLVSPRAFNRNVPSSSRLAQATAVEDVPPYSSDENVLARELTEMEKSYQARQTSLDPAEKAVYQKSLESLDTSINECRASVRREPANYLAHEYLLTAYAQKAELLASALEFEGR